VITARLLLLLALCWSGLYAAQVQAQSIYYRYPGPDGTVVIDTSVPPDAVPRGYDIIRLDGTVVKTIGPKLSDAERKARELKYGIEEAKAEEDAKKRKWDESLLLRYSNTHDIDVAKKRALNDIKVRISILKSNLSVIKQQIYSNQSEAAELERRGHAVPSELTDTLASLRRELTTTEQHITSRQEELGQVAASYERDKARFADLQEQVELRRNYYARPKK
jgi:chromosome segregation ATPase